MTEQPVLFGEGGALFGVVTRPTTVAAEPVACLMLNAGLIHRVGPHRLHVRLARGLAERGITAMRFDLAGIGDSPTAISGRSFRDQGVHDIRAAMDWIEREFGIRRFLLFGICAGAVNAHWTSLADDRVVGLLMFDGFWYRSRWTEPVRVWKRLRRMHFGEWSTAAIRRLRRAAKPVAEDAAKANVFASWDVGNPPKAEFAGQLNTLVNRGVLVFLLYGGSVMEYYSYAKQFRDSFRGESFVDHVRCEFDPDLDHTVTQLETQHRLVRLVCEWAYGACKSPAIGRS